MRRHQHHRDAERELLSVAGRVRRAAARARCDERGFTLPELLIGVMIGLVVIGTALGVLSMAVRAQPESTDRDTQLQQGRTMIERMTREIRQGERLIEPTAAGFSVLTYVDKATCGGVSAETALFCRVTYACGSTSCTRTERNPDGTGTASTETAVTGITGPNVFAYQGSATDPSYVGVQLVFPRDGGAEAVTLSDGATLRNYFSSEPPEVPE